MPNETTTKAVITVGGLAILSFAGNLINRVMGLLIALAVLTLVDYITGVVNASQNGVLSSKKGFQGIIRKLCYVAVIIVAMILDFLISFTTGSLGIEFTSAYVTAIVTLWLCANEAISILENINGMGVDFPKFLAKAFSKVKDAAEKVGEKKIKGGNDNNGDNDR